MVLAIQCPSVLLMGRGPFFIIYVRYKLNSGGVQVGHVPHHLECVASSKNHVGLAPFLKTLHILHPRIELLEAPAP